MKMNRLTTIVWLGAALVACGEQEQSSDVSEATRGDTPDQTTQIAEPDIDQVEPETLPVPHRAGLDLRKLEVPDGMRLLDNTNTVTLGWAGKMEIKQAVNRFEAIMLAEDWVVDTEAGYTLESVAMRNFEKDGYTLGMTASLDSDGETSISAYNYGNLNLADLPKVEYEGEKSNAPNSFAYTSSADVPSAANQVQSELEADGWKAYDIPNSRKVIQADTNRISLIRHDQKLDVIVSIWPSSPDATTVQYNINMLPMIMPIHPSATDVEFLESRDYLQYISEHEAGFLKDYYREEMVGLGWNTMGIKETMEPGQSGLFLFHQEDSMATSVILEPVVGGTAVTLRRFDSSRQVSCGKDDEEAC